MIIMKAYLALEDGTIFEGISCGAEGEVIGEVVFTTAMTGYQEALTDPSYHGQIVTMTYPLVGNYGVNEEDNESEKIQVSGFIVRELCKNPSNWRMTGTLDEFLKKNNIVSIEGIDTRQLTKIIREKGAMNGMISTDQNFDFAKVADKIKEYKIKDAAYKTTCKKEYTVRSENATKNVAMIDLGQKSQIVNNLVERNCNVTVFPAKTPAEDIISRNFDGIMLSNGPGDPKDCTEVIENIKKWQEKKIPIFGICLGHQLVALSNGLDTVKMKYGHRGSNHPVLHIEKNRTYITSQNHGYMVLNDNIDPKVAEITHFNINDKTVEGVKYKKAPVFTVQFHPEASQGPLDTAYLFDDFIKFMEDNKYAKK